MTSWHDRRHNLDYDSAVALRYHGRRQAFLDRIARFDPAISVVFGGAAFAAVVGDQKELAAYAALIVAATSALNLAFGFGDRARIHEKLVQEWASLISELVTLEEGEEDRLRGLEAKRAKIDAGSPWQLVALSALCENEEKMVRRVKKLAPIPWYQRVIANWFTWPWWYPKVEEETSST